MLQGEYPIKNRVAVMYSTALSEISDPSVAHAHMHASSKQTSIFGAVNPMLDEGDLHC
jgi:hypothetical protein